MTAIIILVVVIILIIWAISLYNRLVKLRNNRENAFADIDVQLKQRHDLVPQLVETVKGYAAHEKETFEKVVAARNNAVSAKSIDDKIVAENALSSALAGLKVTLEAYPELKANQNFMCNLYGFNHDKLDELTKTNFAPYTEVFKDYKCTIIPAKDEKSSPMLVVTNKKKQLNITPNTNIVTLGKKGKETARLNSVIIYVDKNNTFYLPTKLADYLK